MIVCSGCGRRHALRVYPLRCSCGVTTRHSGPVPVAGNAWVSLHEYAVQQEDAWDAAAAAQWYRGWLRRLPASPGYCATCAVEWSRYTQRVNPPRFASPAEFFAWAVEAHNHVSANRVVPPRPALSLAQAYGVWRRTGQYVADVPEQPVAVDVVVPFWAGDRHFVRECVWAMLRQRHAAAVVHVVADGCEFPPLPESPRVRRYRTPGKWGPYRIANSLVRWGHCQTDYLAIQDADDLSVPDRLWRQVATMERFGYQMAGGCMTNMPADGYTGDRHRIEPVVTVWRTYATAPMGHLVNGVRTLRRELFERVNGFADWRCSADFDFDNRVLHIGGAECIPVFGATNIDGLRRLHNVSLTHGAEFALRAPARLELGERCMEHLARMQERPTLEQARGLGGLDRAGQLRGCE